MAIKSIKVLNVMAFQRQWRKNNEDCNTYNGINILIGGNGVGKTDYFSGNQSDLDVLKNHARKEDYSFFEVSDGEHTFTINLSHKGFLDYDKWLGLNIQSVYIPTMDMLSHSKGFLALDKKYKGGNVKCNIVN